MGEDPGNQAGYQPWRYLKNNNVTGNGEASLAYNLYADSAHTQILMPENAGAPLVVDFTLTGGNGSTYVSSNGSIPIYARIAAVRALCRPIFITAITHLSPCVIRL